MKTKKLLFLIALVAVSLMSVSAQKLLISEEFSSPEWQAEFSKLNPGATDSTAATLINPNATNVLQWAARTPADGTYGAYLYSPMNNTDLYFGKYNIAGNTEIINGSKPIIKVDADGGDHNVVISEGLRTGESFPMALRLNKTNGFFEFPEVTSAGRIYMHVLCGNNTTASELDVQKFEAGAWTTIKSAIAIKKRDLVTNIDEVLYYYVDSRTPVKLRIAHTSTKPFVGLFETSIEEHPSVDLKQSIDSANLILSNNASNIGSTNGQFPQAVYDSLALSVSNANLIFGELASSRAALINSTSNVNATIAYFLANVNDIGVGFYNPTIINIKLNGRNLLVEKATKISIYNTVGTLVLERDNVKELQVPTEIGNGIFLVKSGLNVQKIYLNN